jgi:protoporphyrinogen oxidase
MHVAIIGAGPAGLTAAYELSEAGVKVEVFEASGQVGGMARTFELWGQKVDLGPHRFFSSDMRVNKLWLKVVGQDYRMVDRLTRIYYRGRFFNYPLKPLDALTNIGISEAAACVASYARERCFPIQQDGSFEDWVVSRFGRRLFEIFFKSYSEKLWGLTCKELDADFAAQRIKKLSLLEAIKNAVLQGRGNTHKTLVDQFAYPLGGTGMVYDRMAAHVRTHGGRVHLNMPVKRVLATGNRVTGVELNSGETRSYDHVISSMPLPLMVSRLPGVPAPIKKAADSLTFRNTVLVYLKVEGTDLFPDNWLYVHSADLKMGRITNFRNWVPELYRNETSTILALEYWCYDSDALWHQDDAGLITLARDEAARTGLLKGARVSAGHVVRVPRCYPVYRRGYRQELSPVEQYLSSLQGLTAIGRYGAFKYNNQDHSILMGMLAARNLVEGTQQELWSINTDYENYQEQSVITRTGLSPQKLPRAA